MVVPKTRRVPTDKKKWSACGVEEVMQAFKVSFDGLTDVDVFSRRSAHGKNVLPKPERTSLIVRFLNQLKSPLTAVLFIAFLITFMLEEYVDAIVISAALLFAVIIGLIQEGKADKAFEKLTESQVTFATVFREGKRHEVLSGELVPGDIVMLSGGSYVPADMRIIEAKNLSINEAALTGEWLSVPKGIDPVPKGIPLAETSSMAYTGTYVATGYGKGVVTETGVHTVIGNLATDLNAIVDEKTPIQLEMERISKIMLVVVVFLIGVIVSIGVLHAYSLEDMLFTAIAIAVAAIPEGLPAAVTIILAVGMEALLLRGGLVRNLLAAETLGSTTYIITDKTGTLTEGKMKITHVTYLGCAKNTKTNECNWKEDPKAQTILDTALCASDAYLDEKHNGTEEYIVKGEPMERAILEAAQDIGITLTGSSMRAKRVDFLAFESENRFAAGLTDTGKHFDLCFNGAPQLLLDHSIKVLGEKGIRKITEADRDFFEKAIIKETKKGRRLIAIARRPFDTNEIPDGTTSFFDDLTFLGLLILSDPVRDDVSQAVRDVSDAGARVLLLTGDNAETALAVAREVGIAKPQEKAVHGKEMESLSDDELIKTIACSSVYARVLPSQKMRIVNVLQERGEIVAMTGDGINDTLALRKANIGVAVGSGTEVAKEASDLVLVNDSFTTIRAAIEEGRRIISNLRKIVGYLLSTSLSEAVLITGALLAGGPIPILPAQILWANIIEEGFMSVAFAFEKSDPKVMKEKPRNIHKEGAVNKTMLAFIGMVMIVISALLLALYFILLSFSVTTEMLQSIMFLAIAADSLFVSFSFRSLTVPVWKISFFTNKYFLGSFVFNVLLLIVVLSIPFFQNILSYTPIGWFFVPFILIYGLLTLVTIEIAKWYFFERKLK